MGSFTNRAVTFGLSLFIVRMHARCPIHHPCRAYILLALLSLPLRSIGATESCDPAVIDTVVTNSPLCPGDHVNLSVVASGDILGYSWQGPGTGEYFTSTPEYSFSFQVLGEYTVVVYGECGNDTAMVMIDAAGAGAGQDDTLHLCDDGPPRELAMQLGPHAEGGSWTFGELPHGGIYDPAMDVPGDYMYTAPFPATCPGTSQTATITVEVSHTGADTATTACALDSAFDLMGFLPPDVTPGGTWGRYVFLSIEPHSGTYDPLIDSSGVFRYTVQGCAASVIVTEIPALPWYRDADNDGFGDPLAPEWSCGQPEGYVTDSTDNCAYMPGKIRDVCDDGLAWTIDDVITDSCVCAGVNTTVVISPEDQKLKFSIWPDPNADGNLNILADDDGPVVVRIFDSLGRLLKTDHLRFTPHGGPVHMALGDLPKGVYMVHLTLKGRSGAIPLLIR